MCGGTDYETSQPARRQGLSPRVRGNQWAEDNDSAILGSIPACAGEPKPGRQAACDGAVYPRVCGGTAQGLQRMADGRGLSPRVRGNRGAAGAALVLVRSIPACAGEPLIGRVPGTLHWVYPRVCGGTLVLGAPTRVSSGLSPRVRGNQLRALSPVFVWRSIPACAGEPTAPPCSPLGQQVYPRVCGGTPVKTECKHQYIGLSPRVRGNRLASSCVASR